MVDHIPDQTDTNCCDGAWEKSEGTVDRFAFYQLGIYHHNKNKCDADLTDDTCDYKINIMPECLPERCVMEQLYVIIKTCKCLLRATLPFKETVYQRRNQRYENRENKHDNRNQQVQYYGFCLGLNCI